MLRRKFFLRIKQTKNIHQATLFDIKTIKLVIINNEKLGLKKILKFFGALKLITLEQPMFLRLKKTQVRLNLKFGWPIGVFKKLRKKKFLFFLKKFKWEILPQLNNSWFFKKKIKTTFSLMIKNVFVFSNLKPFFFFFNNFFYIQICFFFNTKKYQEIFFILRYYQIPFKQKV